MSKWMCGVITVQKRRDVTLTRTLNSLCDAGFHIRKLFVDGAKTNEGYDVWKIDCTFRYPALGNYGNWITSMWEMYMLDHSADFYAMFEDDIVCCSDIREYIEKSNLPEKAYFNLYTYPDNEKKASQENQKGWFRSNQRGLGALALVFPKKAIELLLTHSQIFEHRQSPKGKAWIDGVVVDVLRKMGWSEYCHTPSLVQHAGLYSTIGNGSQPIAVSFPGENFSAITLLEGERNEVGGRSPVLCGQA